MAHSLQMHFNDQTNILGISNLLLGLLDLSNKINLVPYYFILRQFSCVFKELQCGDNTVHLQCCRYKGIIQVVFSFFIERNNGSRRVSIENMLPIYNSIRFNLKFGKILENLD